LVLCEFPLVASGRSGISWLAAWDCAGAVAIRIRFPQGTTATHTRAAEPCPLAVSLALRPRRKRIINGVKSNPPDLLEKVLFIVTLSSKWQSALVRLVGEIPRKSGLFAHSGEMYQNFSAGQTAWRREGDSNFRSGISGPSVNQFVTISAGAALASIRTSHSNLNAWTLRH
jgi:hypothetical protein